MSSSKHRQGETIAQKRARRILAFFLFLTFSLLSLSLCVRFAFVSKNAILSAMTSDAYVSGATKSAVDYSHDLCDECGIPYDSVDKNVNYDIIYSIQKAYYGGILNSSAEYTDTTYQDYIQNLGKNLKKSTLSMLSEQNIETAADKEKAVDKFVGNITSYVTEITEIPYAGMLKTLVTVGGIAALVAAAVFAVIALVLILIIVSIGSKIHRALREIAFSLYAASLLNILLVGGVEIVKLFKTLVLYPLYLGEAVMNYVNGCLVSVGWSSFALFLCGAVLTSVVWIINKNENS